MRRKKTVKRTKIRTKTCIDEYIFENLYKMIARVEKLEKAVFKKRAA